MAQWIVSGLFILLGFVLLSLIKIWIRPRLDPADHGIRTDEAILEVNGIKEPTRGFLTISGTGLQWRPFSIPMVPAPPIDIPLSAISSLSLGEKRWQNNFIRPIVVVIRDAILQIYLEGHVVQQAVNSDHQRRWINDVMALLDSRISERDEKFAPHDAGPNRRYLLPLILIVMDIVLVLVMFMRAGVELSWPSVSLLLAIIMTIIVVYRLIRDWTVD